MCLAVAFRSCASIFKVHLLDSAACQLADAAVWPSEASEQFPVQQSASCCNVFALWSK